MLDVKKQGLLIAVCGLDGSGKTTQIIALKEKLTAAGKDVILLKQPTDWYRNNPIVRKRLDSNDKGTDVRFLSLMSAADRLKQTLEVIEPALSEGKIVVMDRYVYSAYAYMTARGLADIEWLYELNKFAPKPHLTFYLDLEPSISLNRVISRDGESKKKEEQDLVTMSRVCDNFRTLSEVFDLIKIDGKKSKDDISLEIYEKVLSII